jgi:hypothetical protein
MEDKGNFEFVPGTKCCTMKWIVPTETKGKRILLAFPFKKTKIFEFPIGYNEYTNPEITVNNGIRKYSKVK